MIDLGGGVTLQSLLFDTPFAAAYTIGTGAPGSQSLTLNDGGSIQASNTIGRNQIINAVLILGTDGSAQSYSLVNNDADNSLTFAGGIRGGTGGTAGAKTLSVATPGPIIISGPIFNGGATSLGLTKTGTGTLTLTGVNTQTGGTNVQGPLTISGTGSIAPVTGVALTLGGAAVGTMNYDSSALSRFGSIIIGNGNDGAGNCTLNQTAGTINATSLTLNNGYTGSGAGDVNLSGGLLAVSGAATLSNQVAADNTWSTMKVSGTGNLTVGGGLKLTGAPSAGRNAAGRMTQSGGNVTVSGGLNLARTTTSNAAPRRGEYNLNGGTLNVNQITQDAGTDTFGAFNFNGGTLAPTASSTTFLQGLTRANIRDGGAMINTNGRDITIAQPLLHSDIAGDAATDGGLNKTGIGTLTLQGANTYTGATTVSEGRLVVAGTCTSGMTVSGGTLVSQGTPSTTGNVNIQSSGRVEVGIDGVSVGTQYDQLSVGGSVTLAGALDIIAAPGLASGTTFIIVVKTSAGAVSGTFSGRANGSAFAASGYVWLISYNGGDGNDVTLTTATQQQAWRFTHFGTVGNIGTAADTFDANNDGEMNLLEFATAQNPHAATLASTALVKNGATMEFTYTRSTAATSDGVTFTVEWSDTLAVGSWSSAGVTAQIISDSGTVQLVKASVVAGSTKRFIRLETSKP